jgi:methyltransferase-like protein
MKLTFSGFTSFNSLYSIYANLNFTHDTQNLRRIYAEFTHDTQKYNILRTILVLRNSIKFTQFTRKYFTQNLRTLLIGNEIYANFTQNLRILRGVSEIYAFYAEFTQFTRRRKHLRMSTRIYAEFTQFTRACVKCKIIYAGLRSLHSLRRFTHEAVC